jgi:hypothetical protein
LIAFVLSISILDPCLVGPPECSPVGRREAGVGLASRVGRIFDPIIEPGYGGLPSSNRYEFSNPNQDWSASFSPRGVRVARRTPKFAGPPLSIELSAFGRAGRLLEVESGIVSRVRERVSIERGSLIEWYVNKSRGLEHGFTLRDRPPGREELVFELDLAGGRVSKGVDSLRIDTEAGHVFAYGHALAVDANGREIPVELVVNDPNRFQLRVDDAHATYPLIVDPLLEASPADEILATQENVQLGFSVASAGDVNGDGYDDLIIGSPTHTVGTYGGGAAFIYHGSATGFVGNHSSTAATILSSTQHGAFMGTSVSTAGDVNNDGFDDVIVGAPGFSNGETLEGAAFVFLGSAAGIASGNDSLAASRLEADQVGALMGSAVASGGDVNGDGFSDVLVASLLYDAGESAEGAVFVFHGSLGGVSHGNPSTAPTRLEANQVGARLGHGIAGAGDVNGDGFDDVIVGAPGYDAGQGRGEGIALVFHGSASGVSNGNPTNASALLESNESDARFGTSVGGGGDVNGDGFDDVIVGSWQYPIEGIGSGSAFVFEGGPTGVPDGNPTLASARLEASVELAGFGESVANAGDINSDGYDDVIVGAVSQIEGSLLPGSAYLFLGGTAGIAHVASDDAAVEFGSVHSPFSFGHSVSHAEDVDGDGLGDALVGAPDGAPADPSSGGRAFFFRGSYVVPEPTISSAFAFGSILMGILAQRRFRSR